MKKQITTPKAPKAIGPYSQAVSVGNFVFISGQIPIEPSTGNIVSDDIKIQTNRVIENIKAILESQNLNLENIVKTTVYLTDLSDFASFNEEYEKFFKNTIPPARATVQVPRLPKDVKVEIDAIAYFEKL